MATMMSTTPMSLLPLSDCLPHTSKMNKLLRRQRELAVLEQVAMAKIEMIGMYRELFSELMQIIRR